MTQEDKELLLKDLCTRLPYWTIVKMADGGIEPLLNVNVDTFICNGLKGLPIPYLRPMSSMTEEEKKELNNILEFQYYSDDSCMCESTDWLNAHHFDYRGLIEMGLALEAPENMY